MISEELMLLHGILKDGRILVCQKIRKKKWSRFLQSTAFNVYNVRTLEHFDRWRFDLFIL